MKNSFSFSALTLSSLSCFFQASLIYWPGKLSGSVPAADVFQKDLLVLFILLASCSSKYFLACLIMFLYLSCQSLWSFLPSSFRHNVQFRTCSKQMLCDTSYSGEKTTTILEQKCCHGIPQNLD